MKLTFLNLPDDLIAGVSRLTTILDYELSSAGIPVSVSRGDVICAKLENGCGTITYKDKHHFFRTLGLFIEHARKEQSFCVTENPPFNTVGVMLLATGTLYNVDTIKRHLDYLAVMGYNLAMMYTEDSFDVDSAPYFGYMSARYTFDELKECDDYAYEYGIEMIPCIQTFGHLARYLKWPQVASVKDTDAVLLAGSEETYAFLDNLIRSATAPYRSNRIHLGMDEAWDMGRGAYMNKNGYIPPFEIFINHLNRVIDITDKYGLKPMIWSDMFFRIGEPSHLYYEKETIVPDEIKAQIPEGLQLVYWHYGEKPGCDDYMLTKHEELNRDIIFAGGLWNWSGHLPENNYAFETSSIALSACKKHGIKEVMTTSWSSQCEYSILLGLSFTAELAYRDDVDQAHLKSRFEACTKGDFDAFWAMSEYHNIFDDGRVYENYHDRFAGMPLFYRDILEGIFDRTAYELKLSDHYKKYAGIMSTYHGEWENLYRYAEDLFGYLHLKTTIAESLKPAYDTGDRKTLSIIANEMLPALSEKAKSIHKNRKVAWKQYFKPMGYRAMNNPYHIILAEIEHATERLNEYLNGECDRIDELEEKRLPYPLTGFPKYPKVTS